jgi:hypothetical protein
LFLDADDYMSPQMVELLEDALDRNPAARVAYCDKVVFGDEAVMRRLNLSPNWRAGAFSVQRLKFKNFVMATSLIRRSSLAAFDERIVRLTDWDTWLGLLKDDAHAVYVPQPLLHYRAHGENVSIRKRELVERLKIMVKHRLIRVEPLAGTAVGSGANGRRSVVVLTLGSGHAQLAPWQDLSRRNRWHVRAIVGVQSGADAAADHPARAPGVVLQAAVAADLEDLFRRFAGVVGDVRADAVIVTGNPRTLPEGVATFDAADDVLRTAHSLPEVMAMKSLEGLGEFALAPTTVRTLLYLPAVARLTALGRARQAAADLFTRHLAWRFRGHAPTARSGRN